MVDSPSRTMSSKDRAKLLGYRPIAQPEPEQLRAWIQAADKDVVETTSTRLKNIREEEDKILAKIEELKGIIDERCAGFEVAIEGPPSAIFKAMARIFRIQATKITYDQYRRCIELRQQLALEDAEEIQNS